MSFNAKVGTGHRKLSRRRRDERRNQLVAPESIEEAVKRRNELREKELLSIVSEEGEDEDT